MTIWEIEQAIIDCVDAETGEIADYERFEALQMERDAKIENTALYVKQLKAEAKAIREEEKTLAERRQAVERKAERLGEYLSRFLDGEKWKSAKVDITYRKSTAVEVDADFLDWALLNADELLTYKPPEISKTAIKDYLSKGNTLDKARIVERLSMSIK